MNGDLTDDGRYSWMEQGLVGNSKAAVKHEFCQRYFEAYGAYSYEQKREELSRRMSELIDYIEEVRRRISALTLMMENKAVRLERSGLASVGRFETWCEGRYLRA